MNSRPADDPSIWEDMREHLMNLTLKQLRQIAKDEHISLGYDASRKDSCVGAIVSTRRHRCRQVNEDPSIHPWRRWRSVNGMA